MLLLQQSLYMPSFSSVCASVTSEAAVCWRRQALWWQRRLRRSTHPPAHRHQPLHTYKHTHTRVPSPLLPPQTPTRTIPLHPFRPSPGPHLRRPRRQTCRPSPRPPLETSTAITCVRQCATRHLPLVRGHMSCALHDAKGPGGWDRAGGERAARGGAGAQCTRETSELCPGLSGLWSWEAQYRFGTKRQGLPNSLARTRVGRRSC